MNVQTRAPAKFTSAEFRRMAMSGGFGDMRVELRRGMLVRMSPQYLKHAHVKHVLAHALEAVLAQAGLPWIVHQEASVDFFDGFEPMPDLVVWDPTGVVMEGPIPAATVRLVVEVADATLADDLGEKLEDYAAAGLTEYWVADVRGRVIQRHADPAANAYTRREPVLFGDPAPWLTRPDLVVPTADLR